MIYGKVKSALRFVISSLKKNEIKLTQRERALNKLKIEINKDIDMAVGMSKGCGLLELLYFVYYLHWVRLLPLFPNAKNEKKELVNLYSNHLDDSFKYMISLTAKYGHWGFVIPEGQKAPVLNIKLVQFLIKHSNYINSKYETESLLQLFEVKVSGKRGQRVRIDFSKIDSDPEVRNFFNYFLRIDKDNNIKVNSKQNKDTLIEDFKNEYSSSADLFQQEMGITIEEFCSLIDELLQKVINCMQAKADEVEKLPNGNIDIMNQITFLVLSKCFMYDKSKLYAEFNSRFHPALNRLTFNVNDFDSRQLRFHHIIRQPILSHKQFIIISPELILDSLFTNIHYSLIESPNVKEEYITRQATLFLNKISSIADKFGFHEVERNKDLYDGKKSIGDIDLILRNDRGHYLLVEAKNHALPMDIYFKDVTKTKEHLLYLQNGWEKKVQRRIEHLNNYHNKYSIPDNYLYIVVSRFPEIISHYSKLLILSIQEFEIWLEKYPTIISFDDFYKAYYGSQMPEFNIKEIEEIQKDMGFINARFAEK